MVFVQPAAAWAYDIDPVTGNSTARYPGDVEIAGALVVPAIAFANLSLSGTLDVAGQTTLADVDADNIVAKTLTLTATLDAVGPVSLGGRTDGTLPAAGMIGQIIAATQGAPVALVSAAFTTLHSIQVPPGVWELTAQCGFSVQAGATMTQAFAGVSLTAGVAVPPPKTHDTFLAGLTVAATQSVALPTGALYASVSVLTTVYAIGRAIFSGGAVNGTGTLAARRIG